VRFISLQQSTILFSPFSFLLSFLLGLDRSESPAGAVSVKDELKVVFEIAE
jgi:hypothetical protein